MTMMQDVRTDADGGMGMIQKPETKVGTDDRQSYADLTFRHSAVPGGKTSEVN